MSIGILIPVKGLRYGKSRLSGVLAPPDRMALVYSMLRHTIDCALGATDVRTVAVVTDQAMNLPDGVEHIPERGLGHNGGLQRAMDLLAGRGTRILLALASDLPELHPSDVDAMIDRARLFSCAIAPDEGDTGTNSIAITLPTAFRFRFGPGSFAAHQHEALLAGAHNFSIVRRPGLAFDLDHPEGLQRMLRTNDRIESLDDLLDGRFSRP